MKISSKLMIVFLCVSLIPLITISLIFFNVTQKTLQEEIGTSSALLSQKSLEDINSVIGVRLEQLKAYAIIISKEPYLLDNNRYFDNMSNRNEYILEKDKEWVKVPKDQITEFINLLISNELSNHIRDEFQLSSLYKEIYGYDVFPEVFVTNKYGANVAQTGRTSDYYQADEKWWQKAKEQGSYVEDVKYDESAGVHSLTLSARIDDENGNFLGIIKAVYDIKDIIDIVKNLDLIVREDDVGYKTHINKKYTTMQFKLVSSDGKIIYSTGEFEFLQDIRNETEALFGSFDDPAHKSYALSRDKYSKTEKLLSHAHSKGYKDFKGLGWYLIIEHEIDEIFFQIQKLKYILGVVSLIITLIVVFSALVFSNVLSKPILQLRDAASRISQGKFIPVKIKSSDEIGDLANSFDEMGESLRKSRGQLKNYNRDLERKVSERTKELELKNKELERFIKFTVGREKRVTELRNQLKSAGIKPVIGTASDNETIRKVGVTKNAAEKKIIQKKADAVKNVVEKKIVPKKVEEKKVNSKEKIEGRER